MKLLGGYMKPINFTVCPMADYNETGNYFYCVHNLKSCNYLCIVNSYWEECPYGSDLNEE